MMKRLGIVKKERVLENRGGIFRHAILERIVT
jgi:hypothetical protein